MKINGNKMWFAGFLVTVMSFFALGETVKPLTENELCGMLGIAFMVVGICVDKEKEK